MQIIKNKWKKLPEQILLPILLMLFAVRKYAYGIDYTDAGFNLDAFIRFHAGSGRRLIPTYWSSFIGHVFTLLPGGDHWAGISFYCSFILAALALVAYFFMKQYANFLVVGFCELVALGFCWAPSTVLYDYVSFLILEVAVVLLLTGVQTNRKGRLVLAGILLGINVFVRIPNLVDCALILLVWAYAFFSHKSWREAAGNTILCVASYVVGLAGSLAVVLWQFGFSELRLAIYDLRTLSDDQENYSIFYMATMSVRQIFTELPKLFQRVVVVQQESLVGITAAILLLSIVAAILGIIFVKKTEWRMLCLTALIFVYISPLGSNTAINLTMLNLFLVLPILGGLLQTCYVWAKEHSRVECKIVCLLLSAFLFFGGCEVIWFGVNYIFRDVKEVQIQSDGSYVDGMWTSADRALEIQEMEQFVADSALEGSSAILYCDAPALATILGLSSVTASPWPDWYTYTLEQFLYEIRNAEGKLANGEQVVVILSKAYYEIYFENAPRVTIGKVCIDDKFFELERYLNANNYEPKLQTENFVICIPNNRNEG